MSRNATIPANVQTYLTNLVHEPKRTYATALATALVKGTKVPAMPEAKWAPKTTAKVTKLIAAKPKAKAAKAA
jgi:hypothetical protein